MEDVVSVEAGEGPVDLEALVMDGLIPGAALGAEFAQTSNAAGAKALAAEETNFYLRLIQPTGMFRRVVKREALPRGEPLLLTKVPG